MMVSISPFDFDDAITIIKELKQVINYLKAKGDASEWLENAQKSLEIAAYKPAELWCNKALKSSSLDDYHKKMLLTIRGYALLKLKRYEEALKDMGSSLEINPSYAVAWKYNGMILTKLGQYNEAIESYDTAITLYTNENAAENKKNCIATLYCKGKAFQAAGKYKEALNSYNKLLELISSDDLLVGKLVWFGHAEANFALGNYDRAIDSYNIVLTLKDIDHEDSMDTAAFDGKIEALEKLGRHSDAEVEKIKKMLTR